MVTKTQARRKQDIKSKLMAAIAMLLVSSIMMVSSTYAWFTLSTAPEVTGISTAVGANGNLEMALMPTDGLTAGEDFGIGYAVDKSMATKSANVANVTWGNLVDLSDSTFYGLDKITLYPAKLNVSEIDGGVQLNAAGMLSYPEYGADGRVTQLKNEGIVTSAYDSTSQSFPQKDGYGVRAVGAASGMTPRQLAYRSARANASTNMELAKVKAAQSLSNNGGALANIVVTKALKDDGTYTQNDVIALRNVVSSLLGTDATATDGVLEYIEEAYRNYIIAYGASKAAQIGLSDDAFSTFRTNVENAATVYDVANIPGIDLPDGVSGYLNALQATRTAVKTAEGELDLLTGDNITWDDLNKALTHLAKVDAMMVNGMTPDQAKTEEGMSKLAGDVINGRGIVVTMASGGGVYADVADHCGDYEAKVEIDEISVSGVTATEVTATMNTQSDEKPDYYLTLLGTAVSNAGAPENAAAGEGGTVMPISDMYGYIVDLAFKTNAANSNLLLQTAAVDRIYENQQGVTEGDLTTMGHGSTMTFTTADNNFTVAQMKNLMDSIRLVFFETGTQKVLAKAKLDMTNGVTEAGSEVTANIYLYQDTAASVRYDEATYAANSGKTYYTYTPAQYAAATPVDGDGKTYYTLADGVYSVANTITEGTDYYERTAEEAYTSIDDATASTYGDQLYVKVDVAAGESLITTPADAVITALTQNTAQAVSVLVYLDGETVTNADVSATGTTSMTGSLNLQFASSANLVPMEYTPLMEQEGSGSATTGNAMTAVTVASGDCTVSNPTFTDKTISFKLLSTADGNAEITTGTVTAVVGTQGSTTENVTATYDSTKGVWNATTTNITPAAGTAVTITYVAPTP